MKQVVIEPGESERDLVMEEIKVSVIIPLYNRKSQIAECLESVLRQTLDGWEAIVVDDGSDDGGHEVVEKYIQKHANIFLYRQKNGGAGSARNAGLEKARGKYAAFLDVGDILPADAYEKLYCYIEQKHADAVVGNAQRSVNGSEPFIPVSMAKMFKRYGSHNCAGEYSIPLQNASVWNKMIKLSLIREHGLRFAKERVAEELEFLIGVFHAADRIFLLNEPVYLYILNESDSASLTGTTSAAVVDSGLAVMKRVSLFFDQQGMPGHEQIFITGPLAWLWTRFGQIRETEDKYAEYERFKEVVQNYVGRPEYRESVKKTFRLFAEDFVKCDYTCYLDRLQAKSPEEIVLNKLSDGKLGFRYVIRCFLAGVRYKWKKRK